MNSNTIAMLSTKYPSAHPFALPAAGYTIATTTRTAATLANTALAVLSVPYGASAQGAVTPMDLNTNEAIIGKAPKFSTLTFDGGRPFKLRACGTITVGADQGSSKGVIIVPYLGTSATLSSDTALFTAAQGTGSIGTSAMSTGPTAGSYNFAIETTMVWDTASDALVTASGWSCIAGNYAALSAAVSTASVDAVSKLSFVLAYEFGTSNAANNVVVSEFAIDRV